MLTCQRCGHLNVPSALICELCAESLLVTCATCLGEVPVDSKFCKHCGAALSAPKIFPPYPDSPVNHLLTTPLSALMPRELEEKIDAVTASLRGERRTVTILRVRFAPTAVAQPGVEQEELFLLLDQLLQSLVAVVYEYEGHLDYLANDGLQALFGAPVTHENDPERALRAALDILAAVRDFGETWQPYDSQVQVCLGVHSGKVVVGSVSERWKMDYTIVGDTVKTVEKLVGLADWGKILVSEKSYRHTRPLFRFRLHKEQGESAATDDALVAYVLQGLRQNPARLRGVPGMQVPLVGRQGALSTIHEAFTAVKQTGKPQVVLLTGEAGVGKSRLVWEVRGAIARPEGAETAVYEGYGLSYARSRPYWVLIDLLRSVIGVSAREPATVQFAGLRNRLQQLSLWQEDVWPYLANLLGLKPEDVDTDIPLRVTDAGMLQRLTYAALRRLFLAEAVTVPIVLIFEDLHWIDEASWEFLQHLIQGIRKAPILLLLVARDEIDLNLAELQTSTRRSDVTFTHVSLLPLDPGESRRLVDQLLHPSTAEAAPLKAKIAALAAGNPFYIEEIIRTLVDDGGLVKEKGSWQPSMQTDNLLEEVPVTLQGLILARFDKLAEPVRQTLQKAAVLGTSFPVSLLSRIHLTEKNELTAHLAELSQRLILIAQALGAEPGYAFRHPLVQEVVYATLLQRERQQLHAAAAAAIAADENWSVEEKIELLAYHYARSPHEDQAITYLLKAAEQAARRYANVTAVSHFRQALSILNADGTTYNSNYFRATIGLGQSLKQLGEYQEAREILSTALQSFLRWSTKAESGDLLPLLLNGLRELADTYVQESAYEEAISHLEAGIEALSDAGRDRYLDIWLSLIERLAFVHMRQGKLDSAFGLAHTATTEIDIHKTRNLVAVADLYNTLGGIAWQQGNMDEAIFYVGQSLEPYKQLGYAWGTANAYSNLGVLHAQQGHWKKTLNYLEKALKIRQDIGDYPRQALSLANLAQLRLQIGDFALAEENLQDAQAIFARMGDNWGLTQVYATQTELALAQKEVEQGTVAATKALELAREIGSQDSLAHALWLRALVLAQEGQGRLGLETAQEAVKVAKSLGSPDLEGDSLRALGVLYAAAQNFQEAETSLRESLELARQIKDPYRQGLVLLELGSLYLRQAEDGESGRKGWQEKAYYLLQEAATRFRKLGAMHDLARLNGLLQGIKGNFSELPAARETAVSPPQVPQGERRRATILWAKLIVPPHTGAETTFATVAAAMSAISTIIQEHQGRVQQHGDDIEAVFGAPIAYEDDTEKAVQSAFYILHHLQQTRYELNLKIKIGISQGEVITSPATLHRSERVIILGQPLEQVQSIAAHTPTGKIWVTESVQRASKRLFTYQMAVAPQNLGIIWELSHIQADPSPKRGLPDRPSRFIGRDSSLRQMLSLSLNLARGIGGWFLIEGEAGIGKSRLLREFRTAVDKPARQVWVGSCSAQRVNQPFYLFTDLLNNVFRIQPTDAVEDVRRKMAKVMAKWPREVYSTQPYLEILLGLQPEGVEGDRLDTLQPDQLRQQIFVAVRRLVHALSKRMSIILILDDLHWIDAVSAELLLFLAPLVTSDSILFIGAQRRQGADLPNDRLIRLQSLMPGQTMYLMLQRLSSGDSHSLIADLFAAGGLPPEVPELILQRSEGNPYFIEEYVRMFIENGYVELVDGRWQINPNYDLQKIDLPSSLEALIRARLDALPPELREILQCAAVIGRQFDAEMLTLLTNNPHVKTDLQRLASRLMIVSDNTSNRWQFSHVLFESIVYNSMLKKHSQQLHGRIAKQLEKTFQESVEKPTAELAYHFTRAGLPEKAIPYLLQTAEQSAARYANEEALIQYQQAAEILQMAAVKNAQYQWRLAIGLGKVYRLIAKFDESLRALQQALPLAENSVFERESAAVIYWEIGQTLRFQGAYQEGFENYQKALTRLGRLDNDRVKAMAARIYEGIAWVHWAQGELGESQQMCQKSLALSQETNSIAERAAVENLLGGIFYRQGDWRAALHHTTRAMVLREQMGYSWGVAATLSNLGILAVLAGHWSKGESFFKRSIALRQEIGDIEGLVIAQNNLGNLLRDQGDLEEAESYLRESLRIAKTFNLRHLLPAALDGLAEVLYLQSKLEEAAEMINAGMAEAMHIGAQEMVAYIYRVQAEILVAQGSVAEGLAAALQAAKKAKEMGNRSYEAAAWRAAADACLHSQDHAKAKAYIEQAQACLADTTDELGVALVMMQLAKVYLAFGQDKEAENELRAARNVFSRLGARLYLQQAEGLQPLEKTYN